MVRQERATHDATQTQIRGSSVLLAGRFVSVGINFLAQVLTVRYLSQADFGAFAYAFAIVALVQTVTPLGLQRAVPRFVPIYQEAQEYRKLFGAIVLVGTTIVAVGVATLTLVHESVAPLAATLAVESLAIALLLILIVLAPIEAFDYFLEDLLAVFGRPRPILVRRHLLAPGLRLIVVIALIVAGSDVRFLALGYVVAGVVGLAIYLPAVIGVFRETGLSERFELHRLEFPVAEMFRFSAPLLSLDLLNLARNTLDVLLVERLHGTDEVALLRAVYPVAHLNELVFANFALLFTPVAARLFARGDKEGINDLYWQTAAWQAVLSFPVFAVTFSLAQGVTVLLFGERYGTSAPILALLSLGYYVNAALGQNSLTLRVFGMVRYLVVSNLLAAAANVALLILLVPPLGALGAAVATSASLIFQNMVNQFGLGRKTPVHAFSRERAGVYVITAIAALGLLAIHLTRLFPMYVDLLLAGLASLGVLRLTRGSLDLPGTFPELLRLPLARRLFG